MFRTLEIFKQDLSETLFKKDFDTVLPYLTKAGNGGVRTGATAEATRARELDVAGDVG